MGKAIKYTAVKIPKEVLRMDANRINGIYITVTGYHYEPGVISLKDKMSAKQYKDFVIFMAATIIAEYVSAINTQKFSSRWKPLSFRYYSWKKAHHLSLNMWEATGHLKRQIKMFKKADFISVGFMQKDVYPKTGVKVNDIARILEYGSNDDTRPPARPLWRPILLHMRKNVSTYYKSYIKELKTLNKSYLFL